MASVINQIHVIRSGDINILKAEVNEWIDSQDAILVRDIRYLTDLKNATLYMVAIHYSTLIQETLDVLTVLTTLTDTEKFALNKFLKCEVDAGNYPRQDDIFFFGWTNEADKLKGWKGTSIITNKQDGVFTSYGLEYAGITDVPAMCNIKPASLTQFTTNNARVSVHCSKLDALVNDTWLIATRTTGGIGVAVGHISDRLTWQIGMAATINEATLDLSDDFYSAAKISSLNTRMTRFSSSIINKTGTDAAFPNFNTAIGGTSFNGVPASGKTIDGAIMYVSFGAHVNFDYEAHWTNYSNFLTDLGL